jgi:TadE-like protein
MVESAIAFPTMVFAMLGIVQLTLLHQARMMLEYAAFSAARAGAVWNADPARMRAAAVLALLPTMPGPPVEAGDGCPAGMRVDDPAALACRFAAASRWNEPSAAVLGKPLIAVETLSPTRQDFAGQEEIDFDLGGDPIEARRKSQLVVRLTYFFELRIPIINWTAGVQSLRAAGRRGRRFGRDARRPGAHGPGVAEAAEPRHEL